MTTDQAIIFTILFFFFALLLWGRLRYDLVAFVALLAALVLGPGGYRFGDYWRMGLPLEVLIVAVSIPMILWVWPF